MDLGIIQLVIEKYGVDLAATAATAAIVAVLVNGLKRFIPVINGTVILIPTAILSWGVTLLAYQPQWMTVFLSGLIVFGGAIGMWESAKMLAHKSGGTEATTGIGINGHTDETAPVAQ